jgi:hypothetical protein
MMHNAQRVHITLDAWVLKEIVGEHPNRSARIQELIIKGWKAEGEDKKQ